MQTKNGSTNFYGIMHFFIDFGFDEEKEMIFATSYFNWTAAVSHRCTFPDKIIQNGRSWFSLKNYFIADFVVNLLPESKVEASCLQFSANRK
jgi:hypothetical protein